MMAERGISVVICTWNRCAILERTLDSLAEVKIPDDLGVEIVVVDNNSSDRTRSLVEGRISSWKAGNLRYAFEPRQGKQFALNQGIEAARFEVLAFTDDDVLFPADWLVRIAERFDAVAVDLAGGKTIPTWPEGKAPVWYDDRMLAVVAGVDIGDELVWDVPADYAPAGTNLLARKALFGRMGGFSETHYRHMDFEFGMRCLARGVRVVYDPAIVVFAPVESEILTRRYFRRWAFKAGIAQDAADESPTPELFGFRRWVVTRLAGDAMWLVLPGLFGSPAERLFRQMRLFRMAGMLTNRWRLRYRSESHAGWVKSRSQKVKNRY